MGDEYSVVDVSGNQNTEDLDSIRQRLTFPTFYGGRTQGRQPTTPISDEDLRPLPPEVLRATPMPEPIYVMPTPDPIHPVIITKQNKNWGPTRYIDTLQLPYSSVISLNFYPKAHNLYFLREVGVVVGRKIILLSASSLWSKEINQKEYRQISFEFQEKKFKAVRFYFPKQFKDCQACKYGYCFVEIDQELPIEAVCNISELHESCLTKPEETMMLVSYSQQDPKKTIYAKPQYVMFSQNIQLLEQKSNQQKQKSLHYQIQAEYVKAGSPIFIKNNSKYQLIGIHIGNLKRNGKGYGIILGQQQRKQLTLFLRRQLDNMINI